MKLSKYVIQISDKNYLYLFNSKNNLAVKVEKKLLDQLSQNEILYQQFNSFMLDKNFLWEENELIENLSSLEELNDKVLRVIILAHGDCNFRCKYCYEKFEDKNIQPKQTHILKFITDKLETHHFDTLHISWFGGEPLLGYREIKFISQELISYAKTNSIKYISDITTNGYLLTPTIFQNLVQNALISTFQITIDGEREGHDYQRILKNGKGTFDRIMKNVQEISKIDSQYQLIIRSNISKENIHEVKKFLQNEAKIFQNNSRIKFLFRNVGNWGCGDRKSGYDVEKFEEDISFDVSRYALNLGYSLYDPYIIPTNQFACYAQKRNSFVIDTSGRILKCTVALYEDFNCIGNLEDGIIDNSLESRWINTFDKLEQKCKSCALLFICKGGFCPKIRVSNSKSHNVCKEMKNLIYNNFRLRILADGFDYTIRGIEQ